MLLSKEILWKEYSSREIKTQAKQSKRTKKKHHSFSFSCFFLATTLCFATQTNPDPTVVFSGLLGNYFSYNVSFFDSSPSFIVA